MMKRRREGGKRESERNVIWTNTIFICVHMLGQHAVAAPRRHPQSAWPASAGLGLPTHPQESGRREARGSGRDRGAPGELSDVRDGRRPTASCFFKPMSHVLGARPAARGGSRAHAGWARRRGEAAPGGAHQRPPYNWWAFPPINGISCPLPPLPRPRAGRAAWEQG